MICTLAAPVPVRGSQLHGLRLIQHDQTIGLSLIRAGIGILDSLQSKHFTMSIRIDRSGKHKPASIHRQRLLRSPQALKE